MVDVLIELFLVAVGILVVSVAGGVRIEARLTKSAWQSGYGFLVARKWLNSIFQGTGEVVSSLRYLLNGLVLLRAITADPGSSRSPSIHLVESTTWCRVSLHG